MIADSFENKFFLSIMRGINDNKLISRPIHIPSHEEEEIEIKVPKIKVEKKINLKIKLATKKKGAITLINRV